MDDNNGSDDEFSDAVDHEMPPIKLECQVPDCTGGTDGARWSCEDETTVAVALLQSHGYTHQAAPTAPTAASTPSSRRPRPHPLNPPKLEAQCSESRFEEWKVEWASYKNTVEMPPGSEASYILDCLPEEVRRDVRSTTDNVRGMAEADLIAAIKHHAVLQRAISARKMELYSLKQEDGEPVRRFHARIQHLARQCQLTVPCPAEACSHHVAPFVSYADEVVKQVVLVGLVDQEIKKDVLGTTGINDKTLAETLGLIEDKEAAARSIASSSSAGHITAYKKIAADDRRLKGSGKCEKCQEMFNNKRVQSGRGKKDDSISTFKICKSCWKKEHPLSRTENRHKTADKKEKTDESAATEVADQFDFFGSSTTTRRRKRGRRPEMTVSAATTETIDAMVYDSTKGWISRHPEHGKVKLTAYTSAEDANKFGITHREVRPTNVSGVCDSGCHNAMYIQWNSSRAI